MKKVWIFLLVPVLIIVLIIIMIALLPLTSRIINNALGPSGVDISPIADLNEKEAGRIERVAAQMEFSDFIHFFRIQEFENHTFISRRYIASHHKHQGRHLEITFTIYYQEEDAIERMQSERNSRQSFDDPFTDFINDNNTEAILRYPFMPTSASGCHAPVNRRLLISHIRIENVVILLWENTQRNDPLDEISNQFIALLAEMLKQD